MQLMSDLPGKTCIPVKERTSPLRDWTSDYNRMLNAWQMSQLLTDKIQTKKVTQRSNTHTVAKVTTSVDIVHG